MPTSCTEPMAWQGPANRHQGLGVHGQVGRSHMHKCHSVVFLHLHAASTDLLKESDVGGC